MGRTKGSLGKKTIEKNKLAAEKPEELPTKAEAKAEVDKQFEKPVA